jgi:hypothetical protein
VSTRCSGYIAPEYAQHGIFSAKSDVFSYCVLVLEIITGRRAYEDLLEHVRKIDLTFEFEQALQFNKYSSNLLQ